MPLIKDTIDKVGQVFGKKPNEEQTMEKMDDNDFVQMVKKIFELRNKKYVHEKQWYINLSFLLGQQWVEWSGRLKKLYEPKVPPWRVKHVSNDIMPAYRKKMAKLNKNRPKLFISAGGDDTKSRAAAKEANDLVEFWWSSPDIDLETELKEGKGYALSCGTGFLKPYWDTTVGEERSKIDAEGQEIKWRDGELGLEACSPFEIVFDPPDARKWKDVRGMLHFRTRTLEYIRNRYPDKGGEVTEEKDTSISDSFWRKIQGMVGTTSQGGIQTEEKSEKCAILKELWLYPCKRFPQGQKIVVAGDKLLEHVDLPYKWLGNEDPFIPIVPIYDMKVPGRIWGRANIEDEIPIQKAKNELLSHIRESERLTSKPKLLLPDGCGVDNVTSEPGENVPWDPQLTGGYKPEWLYPPSIPNYVINGLTKIYAIDFANVTSQHEISKGQTPPGVTAGVAINYLQEQDDTIIGDVSRNYERALETLGNMMLAITEQNYLEDRKLTITGEHGEVRTSTYKKRVIDKETDKVIDEGTIPRGARLVVEAGSSFPTTLAAKQAFTLEIYKLGMLGPRSDKATNKRALRLLELSGIDDMYSEEAADRVQAEEENEGMKAGQSHEVYPYQDHEVHLETHEAFMKKKEFMELSPEIKQMFGDHRKRHQDFIAPPQPGNMPPVKQPGNAPPKGAV